MDISRFEVEQLRPVDRSRIEAALRDILDRVAGSVGVVLALVLEDGKGSHRCHVTHIGLEEAGLEFAADCIAQPAEARPEKTN